VNGNDIMQQAMLAQSAQPSGLNMQGFQNILGNPLFQLGTNILAANGPGATFGTAVGRGANQGIQNLMAMKRQQEMSAYRKLQAQQLKQQIEQAKIKAQEQSRMEQAFNAMIGQQGQEQEGPTRPGESLPNIGATGLHAIDPGLARMLSMSSASDGFNNLMEYYKYASEQGKTAMDHALTQYELEMKSPYYAAEANSSNAYAEYLRAGKPGSGSNRPNSVPSASKQDVKNAETIIDGDSSLGDLSGEDRTRAALFLAEQIKYYQDQGLAGPQARERAREDLMRHPGFSMTENKPFKFFSPSTWMDGSVTFNPYATPGIAPPQVASKPSGETTGRNPIRYSSGYSAKSVQETSKPSGATTGRNRNRNSRGYSARRID